MKNPLVMPKEPNVTWSIDFISDKIECGRQFRVLNIIGDACKIDVPQEISMSMPKKRVIKLLENLLRTVTIYTSTEAIEGLDLKDISYATRLKSGN